MDYNLLSLLIWLPILGGVVVILVGNSRPETARWLSIAISIIVFILSIDLLNGYDSSTHSMQFVEQFSWITQFDINYHIGVDGISLPLIILTTFCLLQHSQAKLLFQMHIQ